MTLKTSLIITGDSSVAKAAVTDLTRAVDAAATSSRAAVAPAQQLDTAQKSVASSARDQAKAIGEADTALADAAKAARQLSTVNGAVVTSNGGAARSTRELTKAVNDNEQAARRHQFAVRNAGQQVGDFGLSISAGISPAQAFAQQAGQMGYALSEMGGKLGAVGTFLTGPWGIALTIAAAVAAPFVEKLFEGAEAAKAVELGSSGLADAQGALGQVFDLTTGKLKKQNVELAAANELMRLNIRLTAINLRTDAEKEAASSRKAFAAAGSISVGDRIKGAFTDTRLFGTVRGAIDGTERGRQNATNLQNVVSDLQAGRTTNEQVLRASEKLDFTGLKISKQDFQAAIRDGVSAVAKRQIAALADKSLDAGVLDNALRNDGKTKKTPKAKSTAARDEFGRDAADKLAGIVSQFDGTPAVLDKTNTKVRELDDLVDDLGRKRPPGFKELIAQAESAKVIVREGLIREVAKGFEQPKTMAEKAAFAVGQLDAVISDLSKNKPPSFGTLIEDAEKAKAVIRDGLQKPYTDFLQQQQEGLEVQRLTIGGRIDEANALKTIQGLQRSMGPLTVAQKDAVLATVQAQRMQAAELEVLRQNTAKYLDAVGGIKSVVEEATQAFARGDLGQLIKSPGKLLDVFQSFQGKKLFDSIFGETFRDLENQINGTTGVKDASDRMALAVKGVATQTDKTTAALSKLAESATGTAAALSGKPELGSAPADPFQNNAPSLAAMGAPAALLDMLREYVQSQTEIVVEGQRLPKNGEPPKQKPDPFSAAFAKIGTDIASMFTKPENARQIGMQIGKYAGRGLEGAATGSIVAGLGKSIGVNLSQGGAQFGGALGGVLGGIKGLSSALGPFGAALTPVLSIAGGLIGNLLKGKAKPGGATVSASDGVAGVIGSVGSDKSGISVGTGLGGQVASSLNQVVSQLGGTLGNFSVQIGKYKDDLRVNVNGKALGGKKGSGATGFGDDENAAINFAVGQAIAQGAVTGVSAAVAKALQSSTDVEKSLKEALKVQDLELTIGGLGAQFDKAFKDFEAQAKERVRIASAYGFDVVAIEKRNAEDRVKLTDQLLKSQVGSLQSLVSELTTGSLFEGTAMDKIAALNTAITKAKADLDNGVEGASDTLASLYQQKLAASKDAYGSTSLYASDRKDTLNEAQAAIARTNAKLLQAGGSTSDPALATTNLELKSSNAALDENNDQNSRLLAEQQRTNELLTALVKNNNYSPSLLSKLASV